jgi:hypothetical protein
LETKTVSRRQILFVSGTMPLALLMFLTSRLNPGVPSLGASSQSLHNSPVIDIQKDGPLLEGRAISLAEAKKAFQTKLPVPPTNAATGERTAIWIDSRKQIAFVWASDLRFYINRIDAESSRADFVATWKQKTANGDGVFTSVRGEPAIGHDATDDQGISNLSFIDKGLILQFVSPTHSLDDLEAFANAISYED